MRHFKFPDHMKVLVVDDDIVIRSVLKFILENDGFQVLTADNGVEALEEYEKNKDISLIFSDMEMPEMNGIELIKSFRQDQVDIPIIILTGNNEISVALQALNYGANDYLLKDESIKDTVLIGAKRVLEKHMLEKRVDSLLKNTLPVTVVEEIKYKGRFAPRQYACTILFSDFVKFTRQAELMSGKLLIKTLDAVFFGFDDLMARYNGTKIKTIGDAYMAVFGAPTPFGGHAVKALKAALAMFDFVEQFNREKKQEFRMRIGVHTGTVMAGVVGKERMQFDVFGDDVNTAARFEGASEPGRINVSENTYIYTRPFFKFEERGFISLKNKADMKAYFVIAENDAW